MFADLRRTAKSQSVSTKDHALALPPGYRLEGLEFAGVIGQGGFGITYSAVEISVGRRVAVKELLPESIATRLGGSTVQPLGSGRKDDWEWARQRFLEEASILARFTHPAIVGVQRLIEANGTVYVVMDFIEGESLGQRWNRIGCEQSEKDLMELMGPLLDGIEEIHAQGLLHRDIKPYNVLVNHRGQSVLIDFGSAREAVGHRTVSMTSIVSHGYSPIEQYQTRGRMGPWTDIYALGAVMYRGITGEKPPMAADRILDDDYQSLITRGFEKFGVSVLGGIDWALRTRPEERPRTVKQWREVLTSPFEYKRPPQDAPKQERPRPSSKRPRMTSESAERVFSSATSDSFWDKHRRRGTDFLEKGNRGHYVRVAVLIGAMLTTGLVAHSCSQTKADSASSVSTPNLADSPLRDLDLSEVRPRVAPQAAESFDFTEVRPRAGGRVFATDEEARAFLYESPEKAQGAATDPNR